MTALHIHIPKVKVSVPHPDHPDNGFEVRGLNLTDLSALMADHAPNIAILYNQYISQNLDLTNAETATVFSNVTTNMPDLYSDLLARVSDVSPELALQLPISVQLDSLQQIATATFMGENSLEKFLAVAGKMFQDIAATANQLNTRTASTNGTPTIGKT